MDSADPFSPSLFIPQTDWINQLDDDDVNMDSTAKSILPSGRSTIFTSLPKLSHVFNSSIEINYDRNNQLVQKQKKSNQVDGLKKEKKNVLESRHLFRIEHPNPFFKPPTMNDNLVILVDID